MTHLGTLKDSVKAVKTVSWDQLPSLMAPESNESNRARSQLEGLDTKGLGQRVPSWSPVGFELQPRKRSRVTWDHEQKD